MAGRVLQRLTRSRHSLAAWVVLWHGVGVWRAQIPKELPIKDGKLQMYWFDAYEDQWNQPGVVYLFGKVLVRKPDTFASICVTVRGLERVVYVLPREKPDGERFRTQEVYQELVQKVMPGVLRKGARMRVRPVTKNYCFEEAGVPREPTEYLEVRYPAHCPALQANLRGATFSKVFGVNATCMENFILSRDLMGPCWLELSNLVPPRGKVSWCRFEVGVGRATSVVKISGNDANALPTPRLSVMTMAMKTCVDPRTHKHEVVGISCLIHRGVNIDGATPEEKGQLQYFSCITSPGRGVTMPMSIHNQLKKQGMERNVFVLSNERALLAFLLTRISQFDPDVLAGHNMNGFQLDVLLHRMAACNVANWSRIGRLRRSKMPRAGVGSSGNSSHFGVLAAGRLVCDTLLSARELVRETSYSLTNLAKAQLKLRRNDVSGACAACNLACPALTPPLPADRWSPWTFRGTTRTRRPSCAWCSTHKTMPGWCSSSCSSWPCVAAHAPSAKLPSHVLPATVQVMPLTKQITNLSGNLWARSLKVGRTECAYGMLAVADHQVHLLLRWLWPGCTRRAHRVPAAARVLAP